MAAAPHVQLTIHQRAAKEMVDYMNERSLGADVNVVITRLKSVGGVLAWWKANGPKFPVLTRVAVRYLSAHAGSAILEQKFSAAGKNDDKRRHLNEWMQQILLLIAGNKQWHTDLGGVQRVENQEKLQELLDSEIPIQY